MRDTAAIILVVAFVLAAEGAVATDVGTGASVGGHGSSSAEPDGVQAGADVSSAGVYVDPGIVGGFRVNLTQTLILVVEASAYGRAESAILHLSLPVHGYDQLHMFAVRATRDDFGRLLSIPGVAVVYSNEHMRLTLDHAAAYTGATVVWKTYGDRGAGTTIMIVDSGVDGTHPDVRLGANLIQNVAPVFTGTGLLGARNVENAPLTDFDGHGTHVASIAGGTASSVLAPGKYRGLAPESRLIGYAAGTQDSSTGEVAFESQSVLEAFNYAIANQKVYGINVVSNSWGANGDFDVHSPVNIATLQMYKSGLLVVFAAGNEGPAGHSMNKYSVAPWVLSVGAGDYLNRVASFSSRGSDPVESRLAYDHPDLIAPGVDITAAKATIHSPDVVPPGGVVGEYATKSGSSMAAPHVSGVAALLLSANPRLSPDDVMDILTATATPLDQPVWVGGAGYVNALKAYQLAQRSPGHLATFLQGRVKYAGAESGDPSLSRDAVSVGFGAGKAEQLASGSQSLGQFSSDLVGTINGWVFLVGLVVLVPLAFRFRGS